MSIQIKSNLLNCSFLNCAVADVYEALFLVCLSIFLCKNNTVVITVVLNKS